MGMLKPDLGKIVYLLIGALVVPMVLPKLKG